MAGNAKESFLFMIDVSPSMADPASSSSSSEAGKATKLAQALAYVELKLAQFMMRGLKTLEAGVVVFGSSKTRNLLSESGREGYEGIRLLVPIITADNATHDRVKRITAAPAQTFNEADLLSTIICGTAIITDHVGTKKIAKNLVLLTDAECATQWDDSQTLSTIQHMNSNGVELTVVGIDFDDADFGFKEEDKSPIKAENEQKLEDFVEKLDAGLLGNIDRALRAAGGPQMRIPVSRPTQMNMTIGDIASDPDTSLQLQVQYRKAISKAGFPRAFKLSTLDIKPDRPPPGMYDPYLTASKLGISKPDLNKYAVGSDEAAQGLDALQQLFNRFHKDAPARESLLQEKLDSIRQQEAQRMMDVDEEEQNRQSQTDSLSHEVSRGYARFIVPQPDASGKDAQGNTTLKTNAEIERTLVAAAEKGSTAVQLGEDGESLPVKMYDMDKEPTKAYMYGGTIVPVETLGPDESELQLDLKPGIEINGFIAREEIRREWILGEIAYVNAHPSAPKDELLFSALVSALEQEGRIAIARYVAPIKSRTLRMGLLLPRQGDGIQYLVFVQMPFAEDLRKPQFPSLTRLTTTKGKEVTQHPFLPTDQQNEAMASWVDALDLDLAGVDDEGDPVPWFENDECYNPGIHNINAAVAYRHAHPLDVQLPPPHPELVKYMLTPQRVIESAKKAYDSLKDEFDVKSVPIKLATGRGRKRGAADTEDNGDIDFDDFLGSDDDEADKVVGQAATDSVPAASTSKEGDGSGQDSSTEEEDNVAPPSKKPKHEPSSPLKPPATSSSLISEDKPLEDFGKLVVPGADLIAEAVRDMLSTIEKLVANKGGRTWPLAIQCLERVRPVAVEQEQVDQYNTFMRKLKQQCKDSGGGRLTEFWKRHMADKEERGLIHREQSQRSQVEKADAYEFIHKPVLA